MKRIMIIVMALVVTSAVFAQTGADAHYNRGIQALNNEDYIGAVEAFTVAIMINPNHANAFYNRGVARYYNGDTRGAIIDLEAALRINPNHQNARTALNAVRGERAQAQAALDALMLLGQSVRGR